MKTATLQYPMPSGKAKTLVFVQTSPSGLKPVSQGVVSLEDTEGGKMVGCVGMGSFRLRFEKVQKRANTDVLTVVINAVPWPVLKPGEKKGGETHIQPRRDTNAMHVAVCKRFLTLSGNGRLALPDSAGAKHGFLLKDGQPRHYETQGWPKPTSPEDTDALLANVVNQEEPPIAVEDEIDLGSGSPISLDDGDENPLSSAEPKA